MDKRQNGHPLKTEVIYYFHVGLTLKNGQKAKRTSVKGKRSYVKNKRTYVKNKRTYVEKTEGNILFST